MIPVRRAPGILLLALAACSGCGGPAGRDWTDAERAAVRGDVRSFVESIPERLATGGPVAWLDVFDQGPAFFMASDGLAAFPSREAAETFLEGFALTVSGMQLSWDDLRIEPLAPGVATFAAAYHETIEMTDGSTSAFAGYVTGAARETARGWRLQHLHWSSPIQDQAGG